MATFGTTTQAANTVELVNYAYTNYYQIFDIAQPTSISAYIRCNVAGQKVRYGIYEYISDQEAGALLITTALTDVPSGTDGLVTLPVLGNTILPKGKYHLCANGVGDAADDDFKIYEIATATIAGAACWWDEPLLMDPFGEYTPTGYTETVDPNYLTLSLYCTYTVIVPRSFTTRVDCEAAGCYWYDESCHADPYYSHDEYSSGYVLRFQKRQIVGFYQDSGDLRSIAVCASGEVVICSGVHVVADVEVEVSSGQHVVISGQPVDISGQHVHLESGDTIDVYVQSGSLTDARMQGYNWATDAWRNVAVCTSGELYICSGLHVVQKSGAEVLATQQTPEHILIGTLTSGSITNPQYLHSLSGGDALQSGECISVIVKALSTNSGNLYVGGYETAECPMSGYGLLLEAGEAFNIDVNNIGKVHVFAENDGDKVTYIANNY